MQGDIFKADVHRAGQEWSRKLDTGIYWRRMLHYSVRLLSHKPFMPHGKLEVARLKWTAPEVGHWHLLASHGALQSEAPLQLVQLWTSGHRKAMYTAAQELDSVACLSLQEGPSSDRLQTRLLC